MRRLFNAIRKKTSLLAPVLERIAEHEQEYRENYMDLLRIDMIIHFESLTLIQKLKQYRTTNLKKILVFSNSIV